MNIGSGMLLDRTIQPKVRDIEHLGRTDAPTVHYAQWCVFECA